MNFKKASAFLAVFILLVGYVYIVEFKQHDEKAAAKAAAAKVLAVPKDSINAIQLKNTYGEFEIKKIQNEWRLTRPIYTACDENIINTMLNGLESAKKENELAVAPGDMPNFGLAENALTVSLMSKNEHRQLKLGDKTPVGENVFVAGSDTLVFTLAQTIKNNFSKNLFQLRNKKMLRFKQSDVRQIKLRTPKGRFTFQKNAENKWMIAEINRPADSGKMNSLLSKLENTNVKSFVDEAGKAKRKYGLIRPAFQVDLQLGPQQGSKKIQLSNKIRDKYFGVDAERKPIFEVDPAVIKDMDLKLAEFRDKDFAEFKRNEVDKIKLSYGDTTLVLQKDSADVWLTADQAHKIKSGKVSAFFSALNYTTISEFVSDKNVNAAKYGFRKPALSIQLSSKTGQDILSATLGKIRGDKIYAKNSRYASVYLIPLDKLKSLKLKLAEIQEDVPATPSGN